MANQGQNKTISSVSDILGFILEQSELPPEKRTPVRSPRASEVQADSEYIGALVDALAKPGTFVGEEYLKSVQNLIDPKIKIQTSRDRLGDVKLKASDLPKFFENPDEFVDKLFEGPKEISRMQKIQWAGEQMKMLAGSTYAKKNDLFKNYSPEMRAIMERAIGQSAMGSGQASDLTWITQASEKIMKEGHLGKEYERIKSTLESGTSTEEEMSKLQNRLEKIEQTYNNAVNKPVKIGDKVEHKHGGEIDSFRSLLQGEFNALQKDLLNGRDIKDLDENEFLEYSKAVEAGNMVNLWNKYDARGGLPTVNEDLLKQKQSLLQHKNAIEKRGVYNLHGKNIDYSKYSKEELDKHLHLVKTQMRGLTSANRSLMGISFWTKLGQLEGTYHGIKNTLSPGTIEAVLNGDFFDPKYSYFGRPSIIEKKKTFQGAKIEFVKADNKDYKGELKGPLVQKYNDAMVQFHYANPATILRSLFTGERAAWRADNSLEKMKSVLGADFKELGDQEFWDFYRNYKELDVVGQAAYLLEHPKYKDIMGKIASSQEAQKLAKKFERLSGVAKFFNTPTRVMTAIQDGTIGKLRQKMRDGVVGLLSGMKMFAGNEGAMALLRSWASMGGGKALSGAISSAIVGALGLAGTAVGGPLGTAISLAVAAALEKITKITIKFVIYGLVGVFGIVIIGFGALGTFSKQSRVDSYSREVPGTIYYNQSFDTYGASDQADEDDVAIIPPPSGEDCMFGSHSIRCTQGWGGTNCFSHGSILSLKPVDLAPIGWIHAPQFCDNPGAECKILNAGPFYCKGGVPGGGEVYFSAFDGNTTYTFHFVHTILGNGYYPGSTVGAGQNFAFVQQGLAVNNCWTGAHLHLETKQNGSPVDPLALLQSFNCNVPDHSGCTNCN